MKTLARILQRVEATKAPQIEDEAAAEITARIMRGGEFTEIHQIDRKSASDNAYIQCLHKGRRLMISVKAI